MVMKAWLKFMFNVSVTAISVATTQCVSKYANKVRIIRRYHLLKLILNHSGNQLLLIIQVKRFKLTLNMFPVNVFCGIAMGNDITR